MPFPFSYISYNIFVTFIHPEDALRVDVNISVRHADADKLGTKTEVKNIQSWKSLSKAIGIIQNSLHVFCLYFSGVL